MDSTFHGTSNPAVSGGASHHSSGARHDPMFGDDTPGAPAPAPAAPAPAAAANTLNQAVTKATDKAKADAQVAVDPNASHHVKLAATAPTVLGSTAVGAGIGMALAGPPGAALGAGLGWVAERYQIGGGPVGKAWTWLKGKMGK